MYYVYFLLLNNQNIYTGYTSILNRRIAEHNAGKVVSTKHLRPVIFLGYEAYLLKTDAMRRERFLKTTEGKRLFRLQYKDVLKKIIGEKKGSSCHSTGRPIV